MNKKGIIYIKKHVLEGHIFNYKGICIKCTESAEYLANLKHFNLLEFLSCDDIINLFKSRSNHKDFVEEFKNKRCTPPHSKKGKNGKRRRLE